MKNGKLTVGLNTIATAEQHRLLLVFFSQFKSLIVYLLVGAAAVSVAFGDYTEGIAVLIVILINAIIGFLLEAQAILFDCLND